MTRRWCPQPGRSLPALGLLAALAACEEPVEPEWQVIYEGLPGALLRVFGTGPKDVYAVGSDPGDAGAALLHFDGARWARLETGFRGDLWWMDAVSADDLRLVGEGGLVLRHRPSAQTFERLDAPTTATLFGVSASPRGELWVVGGEPGRRGVVLRDRGAGLEPLESVPTPTVAALFKTHALEDGQLWVVGEGGLAARWTGERFEAHPTGRTETLFTVHGAPGGDVYAVGGFGQGVILRWDGTRWHDESPPDAGQVTAVFALDSARVFAAGENGAVFARQDGVWRRLEGVPTLLDFHSIWVDAAGGIWAAGGQLGSNPPTRGVLVHFGPLVPRPLIPTPSI